MREIILSITVFSLLNISSAYSQKPTLKNDNMIFNFNSDNSLKNWNIVDDDVMGGVSSSNIVVNKNGMGLFSGHVSTKNNGGFSSLRHQFKLVNISKYKSFVIRVKGDGKNYQFRVKSNLNEYHSYKYEFKTNNTWQNIEILTIITQIFFDSCSINLRVFILICLIFCKWKFRKLVKFDVTLKV